ncbi:hypothetical protein Ct61P_09449 [Colletotrichum tofieldiae]|nr:hypothetical protein Ct61P_09449 [Colletotrichum tofieldiae]
MTHLSIAGQNARARPSCDASQNPRDALLRNDAVLLVVPPDAEEAVAKVAAAHVAQELLVVGDDDELEVALGLAGLDDGVQALGEALDVVLVEVGCRLVEGDEAAVDAEALGEGEADDDAGEHLLARRAAAAHVHLRVLLDHAYTVVVRAPARRRVLVVGADEDRVNVGALVRALPQLAGDAVDLLHLQAVVPHDGRVQGRDVSAQVFDGRLGRLDLDVRLAVLLGSALVLLLPFQQEPLELLVLCLHLAHDGAAVGDQPVVAVLQLLRFGDQRLVVLVGVARLQLLDVPTENLELLQVLASSDGLLKTGNGALVRCQVGGAAAVNVVLDVVLDHLQLRNRVGNLVPLLGDSLLLGTATLQGVVSDRSSLGNLGLDGLQFLVSLTDQVSLMDLILLQGLDLVLEVLLALQLIEGLAQLVPQLTLLQFDRLELVDLIGASADRAGRLLRHDSVDLRLRVLDVLQGLGDADDRLVEGLDIVQLAFLGTDHGVVLLQLASQSFAFSPERSNLFLHGRELCHQSLGIKQGGGAGEILLGLLLLVGVKKLDQLVRESRLGDIRLVVEVAVAEPALVLLLQSLLTATVVVCQGVQEADVRGVRLYVFLVHLDFLLVVIDGGTVSDRLQGVDDGTAATLRFVCVLDTEIFGTLQFEVNLLLPVPRRVPLLASFGDKLVLALQGIVELSLEGVCLPCGADLCPLRGKPRALHQLAAKLLILALELPQPLILLLELVVVVSVDQRLVCLLQPALDVLKLAVENGLGAFVNVQPVDVHLQDVDSLLDGTHPLLGEDTVLRRRCLATLELGDDARRLVQLTRVLLLRPVKVALLLGQQLLDALVEGLDLSILEIAVVAAEAVELGGVPNQLHAGLKLPFVFVLVRLMLALLGKLGGKLAAGLGELGILGLVLVCFLLVASHALLVLRKRILQVRVVLGKLLEGHLDICYGAFAISKLVPLELEVVDDVQVAVGLLVFLANLLLQLFHLEGEGVTPFPGLLDVVLQCHGALLGTIALLLVDSVLFLEDLELGQFFALLLSEDLEVVDGFGVSHCFKDLIELLLQRRRLAHGPQRLVLVAEDDVVENGPGDAELSRDELVHLGDSGRDDGALAIVVVDQ